MRFVTGLIVAALCFAIPAPARAYPPNFADTPYVTNLNEPTALAFTPDGRLFIAQRGGTVRVVSSAGALLGPAAINLSVQTFEEQGLLGMAFHPQFPDSPKVYLLYTPNGPQTGGVHRISRFDVSGNTFSNERILFNQLPIGPNGWHVGGCLRVSPDLRIFATVGDNGNGTGVQYAQQLSRLEGKMIRLTTTGTIPADNPFVGVGGARGEIYHRGLRNPFRFAIQPGTGIPFICDTGELDWEEVNFGPAGSNFGWPLNEGSVASPPAGVTNPKYTYAHSPPGGFNTSISGATFYTGSVFPAEYSGNFFFLDHSRGHLSRMVLDGSNNVVSVDRTWGLTASDEWLSGPVDLTMGPDGALYYTTYVPAQVRKVAYTGSVGVEDGPGPPAISLALPIPNPFTTATSLEFGMRRTGTVRLAILDVQGRLVRTLVDGERPAGFHTATWDGTDDSGRGVAAGVYLARFSGEGAVATRRVAVIR